MSDGSVAAIIQRHGERIMTLPDVVGIAESIRNDQPCILVLLQRDNAATRAQLPDTLDGVPVFVEIIGPVRASPQ